MLRRLKSALSAVALTLVLGGCVNVMDDVLDPAPHLQPIPAALMAQMRAKGMTPSSPILVRVFKQESELEVWKQAAGGRYELLKTYPMCRWSGKLGPKVKEGDRQAPEGFYTVTAGLLNPKSQYYLSFNLGYPNRLERALGHTGDSLMVHGACASVGCFAMTDEAMGEIYALARDALAGEKKSFQVQAFPFRMTPENMARYRSDPNIAFWRNLKEGYDAFRIRRQEPKISSCGRRYVFDVPDEIAKTLDPLAECPPSVTGGTPDLLAVSAADEEAVKAILSTRQPSKPVAYVDGGMHPSYLQTLRKLGPEGLARASSMKRVPISRPDVLLGAASSDAR
ncbi:hypothetical protein [Antarcticirhabdus aurantiaca]|uniref:hypothetical protein n=1 Tax=Antarcticirhabdus aurantiaca TaxID=2606717 RepID=UPI0034E2AD3F